MGKCPICGSETHPTADPKLDVCINTEVHRPYFLKRKHPRPKFDEEIELSQDLEVQLSKSCPRQGGCGDG